MLFRSNEIHPGSRVQISKSAPRYGGKVGTFAFFGTGASADIAVIETERTKYSVTMVAVSVQHISKL